MSSPDSHVVRRLGPRLLYALAHGGLRRLGDRVGSTRLGAWEQALRYRRALAAFGESDADIWVATYSKSGTTWMQLLLYQLTTDGDMDFDHLFDVSPWVYYAALRGVEPARTPAPRILKAHDESAFFARRRRGRFVFVMRDGMDVALSWYHHRRDFKGFTGTFDEHFDAFLYDPTYNWFTHTAGWLRDAERRDQLTVRYEDLHADLRATALRVADFCGIDVDAPTLDRAVERCSFASMRAHEHRLGPRDAHFAGHPNPPYVVREDGRFIRSGRVGEGRAALTEAQRAAFLRRFEATLGAFPEAAAYGAP